MIGGVSSGNFRRELTWSEPSFVGQLRLALDHGSPPVRQQVQVDNEQQFALKNNAMWGTCS
jgi:hypothetical protein